MSGQEEQGKGLELKAWRAQEKTRVDLAREPEGAAETGQKAKMHLQNWKKQDMKQK